MADLEKKEQRLKEVFQRQAANFREAVYCLFGYRVDMAAESSRLCSALPAPITLTLRPQHADEAAMQLKFRFSNGTMQLLPSEYTRSRLAREVETFIDR